MSKSLFSIPVLLLLALQVSYAQPSMRDWLKVADAAYDTSDYYNAFRYYDAALKYKPNSADSLQILWKYAESARQFDAFLYAKRAYRHILDKGQDQAYPYSLSSFWLAKMEQQLGVYDTAIIYYNYFINNIAKPGTREANEYLTEARRGLNACQFALNELSKGVSLTIDTMSKGINSIYSDYGARVWNDTLYYTSFRFTYNKDKNTLKRKREFNKILTSINGSPGEPLPDSINVEGDHVAHTAFNRDGSRMYYTICEYITLTDVRCDLYMRPRGANNTWGDPIKLAVNLANATNTQPSVGFIQSTGQEVLFFASDRTGGKGGMDIWVGNINQDGDVLTANPVPEVNTIGNDVTPFFLNLTQTLYLSSDNRAQSMGGYDIYESNPISGGNFSEPQPIPYPVNSSYDDLYLSLKEDGTMGYISSNRLGAAKIDKDKEACCLDIFKFDMEIKLLATTCNQLDQSPLIGATVELYEIAAGGDKMIGKPQTNTKGNDFTFSLMPGKTYRLKAMYEGFRTVEDTLAVNEIKFRDEWIIERPLCLGPPIELQVNTFKMFNKQALTGATVALYEITPEGGDELIASTENQQGNNFVFQVMRNKEYRIEASRPYFFPETEVVDLTQIEPSVTEVKRDVYFRQELEIVVVDSTNRQVIPNTTVQRQELAASNIDLGRRINDNGETFLYETTEFDMDKRYRFIVTSPGYSSTFEDWEFSPDAQMVSEGRFIDTIPLSFSLGEVALYFDHDRPDPSTRRVTSTKKYDETIQSYYGRKKEFITRLFGSDLSKLSPQDSLELARYENFFEREMYVEAILNLERLAQKIYQELSNNKSVEITIQGFCSPSGARGYNLDLSRRRIDSVEKYLLSYGNPGKTMADYYNGGNGKLKINKQPFGFDKVDPRVRRLLAGSRVDAVYNIAACLERKVVVKDIIIN